MTKKPRKSFWNTIVLVIVGLVVATVLGEVGLRIAYEGKYAPRPAFYGPSNRMGWAPAPNLDHTFYGPDYNIHVKTDENGYRLGALGEVDFSKELIILCGDSYTFGWGVSTSETFASFLDRKVDGYTRGRVRVVNLGVGGYGTWQHLYRLMGLVNKYNNPNIAAIIVVHCQNDAIDNLKTLGYPLGIWKSGEKASDRSRWHILNFSRHMINVYKQRGKRESVDDLDTRDPFIQDVLWSAQREGPSGLPKSIDVDGDIINLETMLVIDSSEEDMVKRKQLTDIQRQLVYVGNKLIHRQAQALSTRVFHTFVYTTTDWYIQEVNQQIGRSANPDVLGMGRVPQSDTFDGEFINNHSGKHYTPEFNQFWSDRMFQRLVGAGVIERSGNE